MNRVTWLVGIVFLAAAVSAFPAQAADGWVSAHIDNGDLVVGIRPSSSTTVTSYDIALMSITGGWAGQLSFR